MMTSVALGEWSWFIKPFPWWIKYTIIRICNVLSSSRFWQDVSIISCKSPDTFIDLLVTYILLRTLFISLCIESSSSSSDTDRLWECWIFWVHVVWKILGMCWEEVVNFLWWKSSWFFAILSVTISLLWFLKGSKLKGLGCTQEKSKNLDWRIFHSI